MKDYWKALKGSPREHDFLALDTEDDQLGFGPGKGFYMGCVYTPDGPHVFLKRRELIRFLSAERWGGWWCCCHNLEYDALNVFGPGGLASLEPCFSGSKLCGMRLQVRPGTGDRSYLHFFDTSSFLQASLKRLAPLVNEEKLEMNHRPGDRRVTRKRKEYCVQDTKIAWKLAGFIQDGVNSLGAQVRLTAASTALDLYRRKYMTENQPLLPEELLLELTRGYYGGRTECFRLGDFKGEFWGSDVNGMYSSVMIDSTLPALADFKRHRGIDLTAEGMAWVRVEVPDHAWAPPLPVKGAKLTFPTGRLQGYWTYNELRGALNSGVRIVKVLACWHSRRGGSYLSEMNRAMRAIREDPGTAPAVSRMAKLMSNSLYGKFAQRNENFEYMTRAQFAIRLMDGSLGEYLPEATVAFPKFDLIRVVRPADFPRHSNVIWAACITAGARGKLHAHLDEGSTYYTDTDSVIGEAYYPPTKTLGKMAHKESYKRLVIRGPKLYAGQISYSKWEAHAKGVPRDQALTAVLHPGERIESRRPVKFRTAIRDLGTANQWIGVHKELTAEYTKRRVLPDGRTAPLQVRQW